MKKEISICLILMGVLLILISNTQAVYIEDNRTINNINHAIRIQEVNSVPDYIAPGESAAINIKIKNSANLNIDDIRAKLTLPIGFAFLNDVDQIKISSLRSGDSEDISFSIIASQSTNEGVYKSSFTIDYISYLGLNYANVGENKQDNYTFGIVVKADPNILTQIEESGIYKGNNLGEVTIKFINNGVGDAKFLTAELLESEDYEIISSNLDYIGDLDSDDFESIEFKIKLKEEKTTDLLLKISYKDALNKDYSEELTLPLELKDAEELGIKTNGTTTYLVVIIIIVVIIYFLYKRYKKKKNQKRI